MTTHPTPDNRRRRPTGYDACPTVNTHNITAAYQRYAKRLDITHPGWYEDDDTLMVAGLAAIARSRRLYLHAAQTTPRQALDQAITEALPSAGGRVRTLLESLRAELTRIDDYRARVETRPSSSGGEGR